jgi:hypothetical protein
MDPVFNPSTLPPSHGTGLGAPRRDVRPGVPAEAEPHRVSDTVMFLSMFRARA